MREKSFPFALSLYTKYSKLLQLKCRNVLNVLFISGVFLCLVLTLTFNLMRLTGSRGQVISLCVGKSNNDLILSIIIAFQVVFLIFQCVALTIGR